MTFAIHSGDIQVTFMIHSEDIQKFPETFLNIHETFKGHSGDIQVIFKTHSDWNFKMQYERYNETNTMGQM